MIIYRIIASNDSALRKLWEEWWILSCISEGKMYFWKEEKRTVAKKETVETPDFQNWYDLYPKHKSRQQALKEWWILKPEEIELAKKLLPLHIQYWKSKYGKAMKKGKEAIKDLTYVPYPSTWLSAKWWNDEIEIEGKTKDDMIREKEMIEKRRQEEIERRKEEEKEREEAEEISLIIRRLKEQGKYRELENEARHKAPVWSLQFTIDFIARSLVWNDPKKYRKLLNY